MKKTVVAEFLSRGRVERIFKEQSRQGRVEFCQQSGNVNPFIMNIAECSHRIFLEIFHRILDCRILSVAVRHDQQISDSQRLKVCFLFLSHVLLRLSHFLREHGSDLVGQIQFPLAHSDSHRH